MPGARRRPLLHLAYRYRGQKKALSVVLRARVRACLGCGLVRKRAGNSATESLSQNSGMRVKVLGNHTDFRSRNRAAGRMKPSFASELRRLLLYPTELTPHAYLDLFSSSYKDSGFEKISVSLRKFKNRLFMTARNYAAKAGAAWPLSPLALRLQSCFQLQRDEAEEKPSLKPMVPSVFVAQVQVAMVWTVFRFGAVPSLPAWCGNLLARSPIKNCQPT